MDDDRPDIMALIASLDARVAAIETRNQRVETEKAWETSGTRRAGVMVATYLLMVIVFTFIGVSRPFIDAVVPTLGFFLSTLSLRFLKERWIERRVGETAAG